MAKLLAHLAHAGRRGFVDQKPFALSEELGVGYVCAGKLYEDEQRLLDFARPDTVVLYTNLDRGERIDALLEAAGLSDWGEPSRGIELYHGRGADKWVHREEPLADREPLL